MKFQDSSFNGLKVTVGTKKCDPPTHAPKAICPINFFKVGGTINACDIIVVSFSALYEPRCEKKRSSGFLTWSDINRAV